MRKQLLSCLRSSLIMTDLNDFKHDYEEFSDINGISLNDNELHLASVIHSAVFEEVKNNYGLNKSPYYQCDCFPDKVEASKQNLSRLLDLLDKCSKARLEFLKIFPVWRRAREKNIQQLYNIGKIMKTERLACNVSKIVGGSVGVVGGAVCLGSLIFPPAAFALPLVIGSGVVSGVGGLTTAGATIADGILLTKRIDEAKKVLKQDKNWFELMEKWFRHTEDLAEALEDVIGLNVMKTVYEDIRSLLNEAKTMTGKKYYHKLKEVVSKCTKLMCLTMKIELGARLNLIAIIITLLIVLFIARDKNHIVFYSVLVTLKLGVTLYSVVDVGTDLSKSLLSTGLKAATIPKSFSKLVFRGFFTSVGIALDVVTVVLSSIDVAKGSVSEQALAITEAADKLEGELKFLEELHENMR